jgi:hypothetical protein
MRYALEACRFDSRLVGAEIGTLIAQPGRIVSGKRKKRRRESSLHLMKFLKSLEELLSELVSWLVFYPITMWRSLVRPLDMMRYADKELTDAVEDQYDDTLSPPMFLLITS